MSGLIFTFVEHIACLMNESNRLEKNRHYTPNLSPPHGLTWPHLQLLSWPFFLLRTCQEVLKVVGIQAYNNLVIVDAVMKSHLS